MMIKRKVMLGVCSLVLCMLACGCGSRRELVTIGASEEDCVETEEEQQPEEACPDMIYVYVCGAVKAPGVVCLSEGCRVEDALRAAGGFAEDASTDFVNLAAKAADGEKLYFPTAEECMSLPSEQESGLININTASAEVLCTLPGIGEARAADIISYRETVGLFECCEDIMQVNGIKTSVYHKIRDMITVQ